MSNYYGYGRSNYVRVTDVEQFTKLADLYGCDTAPGNTDTGFETIAVFATDDDGDVRHTFISEDEEERNRLQELLPEYKEIMTDDLQDDYELPDFLDSVSKYLVEGEVFVWQHVGNQKMDLGGYASAINSQGERVDLDINDIYERAKTLGNVRIPLH